jgi:Flp pilus assembly protein TadG
MAAPLTLIRRARAHWRDGDRGASAVELAVVAPMTLLLISMMVG